jgi:hypothetical protein
MGPCTVCRLPVAADPETGLHFHPDCLAKRLPQDAVIASLATLALAAAPAIVVWAG